MLARRVRRFARDIGLIAMVKIVCSFYQVLLLLGDIYDIPFPRLYIDFIYRWFSVFEFDFLQLARVDCVRKTRAKFPHHTIMAGNVVTNEMTEELILNGGGRCDPRRASRGRVSARDRSDSGVTSSVRRGHRQGGYWPRQCVHHAQADRCGVPAVVCGA